MDKNETIFIADKSNNRVMEWKKNAAAGRVVARGNGCISAFLMIRQLNKL